jgi:hypothetical protein
MVFLSIGIITVLSSCTQNITNGDSRNGNENNPNIKENTTDKLDSINVVSLKEDYSNGIIDIYNSNGQIWKSFELTDSFMSKQIIPYALKAEDRILVFRCVGRKDGIYAIIVDENKKIIKYIKDKIPYFTYDKWQTHIFKVFSVDFDNKINPLKKEPLMNSVILPRDEEQFYHPVEIKGNWLKVKDDDEKSGWIKWVDDKGQLLITLYYEA